jgi:hypothetical protein
LLRAEEFEKDLREVTENEARLKSKIANIDSQIQHISIWEQPGELCDYFWSYSDHLNSLKTAEDWREFLPTWFKSISISAPNKQGNRVLDFTGLLNLSLSLQVLDGEPNETEQKIGFSTHEKN